PASLLVASLMPELVLLSSHQPCERLVVTGADEPVYAHAGEAVTLSCSVDTHVNVTELQVKWIKTDDDGDILVLLFADGENRPESQDRRYFGRAEFLREEIPKGNFSVKLRKVRTEDKGEFRCEVHSDTDSASTTARIAALGESLEGLVLTCISTYTILMGEFMLGTVIGCHLRNKSIHEISSLNITWSTVSGIITKWKQLGTTATSHKVVGHIK
uniref:Ig-like domain-containing protein n=1 Tax=Paramormyrops kingsleyae TaxID=1676925 RepID=A0A3B3SY18_9TELE